MFHFNFKSARGANYKKYGTNSFYMFFDCTEKGNMREERNLSPAGKLSHRRHLTFSNFLFTQFFEKRTMLGWVGRLIYG